MSTQAALIRERAEKLQAQATALFNEAEVVEATENVAPYSSVSFVYGRGENRRTLEGVVVAIEGDTLAVREGQGFDERVVRIQRRDLRLPTAEAVAEATDYTDPLAGL